MEQGGWSPIVNQTIPLEDRHNFKKFVDTLYSGCVEALRLRIFLGIALLLDYEDVNTQFPALILHNNSFMRVSMLNYNMSLMVS